MPKPHLTITESFFNLKAKEVKVDDSLFLAGNKASVQSVRANPDDTRTLTCTTRGRGPKSIVTIIVPKNTRMNVTRSKTERFPEIH